MWGYANERNRSLGKEMFELILSDKITKKYNQNGQNKKLLDQIFLTNHVWPFAKNSSTIHDSYNCKYSHELFK